MKKIIVLLTTVVLVATASLPAFAAEQEKSSGELEESLSDYDDLIGEAEGEKASLLEQIKVQYDVTEGTNKKFETVAAEYEEFKTLFDKDAKKNSVKLMSNGSLHGAYAEALHAESGVENTMPFNWEGYLDIVLSQREAEYDEAKESVDAESQKLSEMLDELSKATETIDTLKQEREETEIKYNEAKQAEEAAKETKESVIASGDASAFAGLPQEEAQTAVASKIYSVLKYVGWPDEMIAGALGNINVESGLDFTSIEWLSWHCDERFAWGPDKQAWADGDYLIAYLNPGQSNTVIRSGIGLIQWSDTKDGATGNTDLREYAAENDMPWYNLTLQLRYLTDLQNGDTHRADIIINWGNYNDYPKDSPSECAYWWAAYIEGCNIDAGKRQSYANQWYNRLSSLAYDEEYAKQILS